MEQQPAANERSSRPLVRLPHSTRSFSRSRSRSPSRHEDEDEDDGVNRHAPSGSASEGRDSADEPSPVRETAPTRAEEPTALSPSRLDALRRLAIVKMTEERRGEYGPVYELCDASVWVTPAYLIYIAEDSDLPALMKLMDHVFYTGIDLDVHLDIEVVASYFAGPETMEAARLMKLVDDGVGFFQQYATTPEKARFLDLPAVALLRIHAMALQDVGRFAGPEERVKDWGDIHYKSSESSENIRIEWSTPREKKTGGCVQISRVHLGRMMQLVKDLPARGFYGFLGGRLTGNSRGADRADRDFTNFHHAFLLNVQLIADRKLDMFTFHGFENDECREISLRFRLRMRLGLELTHLDPRCFDRRRFDEKIHYVHRKHVATLGELLWEFFQLYTSRPFNPKYYDAEDDAQRHFVHSPYCWYRAAHRPLPRTVKAP